MKKQFILPLSLLLSFVAVRASDVPAVDPSVQVAAEPVAQQAEPAAVEVAAAPVAEPVVPAAVEVAVAETPATPVVAPVVVPVAPAAVENPTTQVVEPAAPVAPVVVPAPAVQPAPATAASSAIPTEDDINNLLGLLAAYQHQSGVLKSLHDLASDDAVTPSLPNEESIRSLLNLLELHKKESDLIVALRASISSLQTVLGKWDADVSALLTKKPSAKQKIAKRSGTDFGIIKDLNKPRGNN